MYYIVAAPFVALWLIGSVTSFTMNGLIHLLLVPAIAAFLIMAHRSRKSS